MKKKTKSYKYFFRNMGLLFPILLRSEERRVGKECDGLC